jgi:hypothetical protein
MKKNLISSVKEIKNEFDKCTKEYILKCKNNNEE